ncbi:kmo [Symbiodinium sp. KB8]|nr:kmo [Symbiodinium sp. KB8]
MTVAVVVVIIIIIVVVVVIVIIVIAGGARTAAQSRGQIESAVVFFALHDCSAYGVATDSVKRSINLALSCRGEAALAEVGLLDAVKPTLVPMHGRVIHDESGALSFQPYGKPGEHISSVSRERLTTLLVTELEKLPNVRLHFNHKLETARPDGTVVFVESDDDGRDVKGGATTRLHAGLVLGADGAFSRVRAAMLRGSRVNFSRRFIDHSYKEFHIAPGADAASAIARRDDEAGYRLEQPHGLHIWPRHEFMLIALPNPDRTFTCTLFAPNATFEELDSAVKADGPGAVVAFFRANFPDALALIGEENVASQYAENPAGSLVTVRVDPWNRGRMLLIGDAAHAIVPFFGQGMNAAFEDALELNASLDLCNGDLDASIKDFVAKRMPTGNGIADLSLENYEEMRSHTASPLFVVSKQIEGLLHALAPTWWIPRYSMVSFSRIPYDEAKARAHRQEAALSVAEAVVGAALAAGALAAGVALARDAPSGFSGLKAAASSALAAVGIGAPASSE